VGKVRREAKPPIESRMAQDNYETVAVFSAGIESTSNQL